MEARLERIEPWNGAMCTRVKVIFFKFSANLPIEATLNLLHQDQANRSTELPWVTGIIRKLTMLLTRFVCHVKVRRRGAHSLEKDGFLRLADD